MFLQNFSHLSQIDLRSFPFHIVEIFPAFDAISLVGVSLEHEFPDLSVLFHKSIKNFSIPVFFLIHINQLDGFDHISSGFLLGLHLSFLVDESLELLLNTLDIGLHPHLHSPFLQLLFQSFVLSGLMIEVLSLDGHFMFSLLLKTLLNHLDLVNSSNVIVVLNDGY